MNDNSSKPNPAGNDQPDYSKPVAYDTQGRPLYLRPQDAEPAVATSSPQAAEAVGAAAASAAVDADSGAAGWAPAFNPRSHGGHQYVHVSRPIAPAEAEIPADILARAEESHRKYPHLNLSKGEYIVMALKRHPIGLFNIWAGTLFIIIALGGTMAAFLSGQQDEGNLMLLATAGLILISFLGIGVALIATYIYNANRFYLTNESVIQEIQVGLFNKHEQTVSLANIEDASYYQEGILPHAFNYGMIRLSTEGDETTYRFTYVAEPKKGIAILNNAVEAFKNGRPVEFDSSTDEPVS